MSQYGSVFVYVSHLSQHRAHEASFCRIYPVHGRSSCRLAVSGMAIVPQAPSKRNMHFPRVPVKTAN